MAPDGQYAVALKMADTPQLLEKLADATGQQPVADLYQMLAKIGVASDAGD
nr:hypothetical protein [Secundilactobacillus collinoides]